MVTTNENIEKTEEAQANPVIKRTRSGYFMNIKRHVYIDLTIEQVIFVQGMYA